MFYAHFVLAKKGPLARIWLAAHWDKKLTKAHVFETNIEKSVDGILQPKVKMALRTSGHLLLGVVRIYSRKAKYLLADCNEAFVKIKMAFRPGIVDLPEDIREAAVSAITFPEVFHDFDTPMPELKDVDIQAQFTLNQSRAEEITMREDYGNISFVTGDDGFGDIGFEEPPELMRATSGIDQSLDQTSLMFAEGLNRDREINASKDQSSRLVSSRTNGSALDLEAPIRDDGFGGNLGQDIIAGGLFEGGLFDDAPIEGPPIDSGQIEKSNKVGEESDDDGGDMDQFGGPPSVGPPSSDGGSRPSSPQNIVGEQDANVADKLAGHAPETQQGVADQTTLMHNEEESFALAPVDSTVIKSGWPRAKRKRKLIVDEIKNISGEEMKSQLSDTTDIVTTLDLAPPSKRLMHWKETGGVEKLFALPGRSLNAIVLGKIYVRNLTSEYSHNEDFGMAGDKEIDNLRLEQVREEDQDAPYIARPRGRPPKRKLTETDMHLENESVGSRSTRSKSGEESFNELIAARNSISDQPQGVADESMQNNLLPNQPEVHSAIENQQEGAAQADANRIFDTAGSPPPMDIHNDDYFDEGHDDSNEEDSPLSPRAKSKGPFEATHQHSSPSKADEFGDNEEQAEDETYEEFEERVVNKRAGLMFHKIKKTLRQDSLKFSEFVHGQNRKVVAQKFYTILVLKKLQAVELQQNAAYEEIVISRGTLFENAKL